MIRIFLLVFFFFIAVAFNRVEAVELPSTAPFGGKIYLKNVNEETCLTFGTVSEDPNEYISIFDGDSIPDFYLINPAQNNKYKSLVKKESNELRTFILVVEKDCSLRVKFYSTSYKAYIRELTSDTITTLSKTSGRASFSSSSGLYETVKVSAR